MPRGGELARRAWARGVGCLWSIGGGGGRARRAGFPFSPPPLSLWLIEGIPTACVWLPTGVSGLARRAPQGGALWMAKMPPPPSCRVGMRGVGPS